MWPAILEYLKICILFRITFDSKDLCLYTSTPLESSNFWPENFWVVLFFFDSHADSDSDSLGLVVSGNFGDKKLVSGACDSWPDNRQINHESRWPFENSRSFVIPILVQDGVHKSPSIVGKTINLNWFAGSLKHQQYDFYHTNSQNFPPENGSKITILS